MKNSLIISGFFASGTLCGLFQLIPSACPTGELSFYALCALMLCVGISIGNEPQSLRSFRSLNPRLFLLPLMTISGTLTGCAITGLFLPGRSLCRKSTGLVLLWGVRPVGHDLRGRQINGKPIPIVKPLSVSAKRRKRISVSRRRWKESASLIHYFSTPHRQKEVSAPTKFKLHVFSNSPQRFGAYPSGSAL